VSSPTKRQIRGAARFIPGGGLAVIGSVAAIAGAGLLAAFGTDGRLASGPHLLSTPATAVVSTVANIKNTSGFAAATGHPTLRISASPIQGTTGVFVGIGREADVDRYLAGVATKEATSVNVEPYALKGITHGGRANVQPPTTQHFWVAQASSPRTAAIGWRIRDGRYRLVVMNANGHGGFAATAAIGITIPYVAYYALAGIIVGLLLATGGTALLIRATRHPVDGNIAVRAPSAAAQTTV
jgi:hypothetical protein